MKRIEYNGKKYKITTQSYTYTYQMLSVNSVGSSIKLLNTQMNNVDAWRKAAKEAIEQYINNKIAQKAFNRWDGKL